MNQKEKSCGAVVYTIMNNTIKYIIIRNKDGYYGFPKGHMESNETEMETAQREVYEETQLVVEINSNFKTTENYMIPHTNIEKEVIYFLGYFENQNYMYLKDELIGIALVSYEEAMTMFHFESTKRILKEANDYLTLGE